MADVEYVEAEELLAYPGVAAPAATLELVRTIVNGLINDIIGVDLGDIPWKIKAMALGLAASRVSGNADGASQVTVQIDDFKETRIWPDGSATRGATLAGGGIGFTGAEIRELLIAAGLATRTQRGSIRLNVPVSTVCR